MSDNQLDPKEREDKKLRKLQWLVQLTTNLLYQEKMPLSEAIRYVEGVKRYALSLFPGKEQAWEMIYAPRFRRILKQRWGYVTGSFEESSS